MSDENSDMLDKYPPPGTPAYEKVKKKYEQSGMRGTCPCCHSVRGHHEMHCIYSQGFPCR